MKKQRILLLSDHQRPASELPVRQDERYRLVYCASDSRSAEVIENLRQRFDWILIDGAEVGGDRRQLFQLLRALYPLLPDKPPDYCSNHLCRVEWDTNGVLQLRCSRRRAGGGARKPGGIKAAEETGSFTFEYHAPMERTG